MPTPAPVARSALRLRLGAAAARSTAAARLTPSARRPQNSVTASIMRPVTSVGIQPEITTESTIISRLWMTSPALPPSPEVSDQLDGTGRAESVALPARLQQTQAKDWRNGRGKP
ncbi:MAG: hypothetical protein NTZ54_08575 [Alphaproteobacteria bacterium]|nr:hypothetical protein [Alphaproteobacteria bacterium]